MYGSFVGALFDDFRPELGGQSACIHSEYLSEMNALKLPEGKRWPTIGSGGHLGSSGDSFCPGEESDHWDLDSTISNNESGNV
jgi:hypothetical protein